MSIPAPIPVAHIAVHRRAEPNPNRCDPGCLFPSPLFCVLGSAVLLVSFPVHQFQELRLFLRKKRRLFPGRVRGTNGVRFDKIPSLFVLMSARPVCEEARQSAERSGKRIKPAANFTLQPANTLYKKILLLHSFGILAICC